MKTERQVRKQLSNVRKELDRLEKIPPGTGAYSRLHRYADALEWVLGEE